jgi:putative oxidoreductase
MDLDLTQAALVLGRALIGGLFVAASIRHYFIAPAIVGMMEARNLPQPRLLLFVGSVWQLVLGALLILGIEVRLAAAGLIVFTLAASLMLLNFWSLDGAEREMAKSVWLSNIAIIGGLLIAAAIAPPPFS